MGFGEAVSKGMANITNFSGRSSRPEFWWFVLAVWVAELVVIGLVSSIFRGGFGSFLTFILYIVFALAFLSVGFRRLQDVGQSGWLVLLSFIPCVGLVLIYFWVQPSAGDNQYGPAPAA
jgi:uncharacterized membrane protein YhaH (DUF805 family)